MDDEGLFYGGFAVRIIVRQEVQSIVAVEVPASLATLPPERYEWRVGHPADCPAEVVLASAGHAKGTVATLTDPDGTVTTWRATGSRREIRWAGREWIAHFEQTLA